MAAYDPYYADVVMLLRGNGTNDSQTITDEKSHTVTVYGNTCIKTATKKFGSGSIYFDGTGDVLTLPQTDFFIATSGDFTIDGWIYPLANSGNIMSLGAVNSNGQFGFRFAASALSFTYIDGTTQQTLTSSVLLNLNEWSFIAASRKSNVTRLYINGSQVASLSGNWPINHSSPIFIGATSTAGSSPINAYLDDWRYTKVGRYDTNPSRVPIYEAPTTNVPPEITLTSITPRKGPTGGGTLITLAGSGFTDYTECTIDGNPVTSMTTISDTEMTGLTPPGTLGLKDVIVTNP
jgi:hypothetical protein